MKTRLLILFFFSMSAIPLIYAEESNIFEIGGYNIITNNPNVSAIDFDWDSEYLPELSVNFTEQYTGQFQIQIPKNMPRTMNLDFETSLMMDVSSLSNEDHEKDWNEHITEKDFKIIDDRINETESLCYYIITVELSEVDYFKIGTYSVASGRWEPVTIENDSCDELYDGLSKSESIPDSESLNKKWGELYLEYQLLKESFSDYPNNMTTIERMAEIDDETMRLTTILSEREFVIVVPEMDVRNATFDDPVEPDCGPNTFLNEMRVCQIIDGGCEPDINGNTTWCGPTYDYWKIFFSSPIAMLVVFGISSLIAGIIIVLIYYIRRKRK